MPWIKPDCHQYISARECRKDTCTFRHAREVVENAKRCPAYEQTKRCDRGDECWMAHINPRLDVCHFNGNCKKPLCVFSHPAKDDVVPSPGAHVPNGLKQKQPAQPKPQMRPHPDNRNDDSAPAKWRAGSSQYTGGPSQYNGRASQYNGGPSQYNGGPSQYNGGPSQYNGGPSQNNGGPSQNNGRPKYPREGPAVTRPVPEKHGPAQADATATAYARPTRAPMPKAAQPAQSPDSPISTLDQCMPLTKTYTAIKSQIKTCTEALRQCISDCDGLAQKIGLETNGLTESCRRLDNNYASDARELAVYFPVYGVVKAGKSTLLSCLTRTSILPSRPLPMTTIPIKILHKGGTEGISLVIPNAEQWNACIADVVRTKTLPTGKDLPNHVTTIFSEAKAGRVRFKTGTVLRDADAIADELMLLSDVARLCFLLEVDFDKYNIDLSLEHLPLITMDIAIFRNLGVDRPFYLVDTPGPNEACCGEFLERINQRVLDGSKGALLVAPQNQIGSNAMNDVLGNIADSKRKILVALNHVDGMSDRKKELPDVIKRLEGIMSEADCLFEIIPVAASRIKMMCELQAELHSGRAGFAESKIWTQVVEAMGINTEQLVDVKEYARKIIPQELETYNAVDLVKAIKGFYLDWEGFALQTRVDDLTYVRKALDKFVEQIKTSMKDKVAQDNELTKLRNAQENANGFRSQVRNLVLTLRLTLRNSFNVERENFIAVTKKLVQENVKIVNADNPTAKSMRFKSSVVMITWCTDNTVRIAKSTIAPRCNEFLDTVRKNTSGVVEFEWRKLQTLLKEVEHNIGQRLGLTNLSQPPTFTLRNPNYTVDPDNIDFSVFSEREKGGVVIKDTDTFVDVVSQNLIKTASLFANAAYARFEESLEAVLAKFQVRAEEYVRRVDDLIKCQTGLQNARGEHKLAELRAYEASASANYEQAKKLLVDLRAALGLPPDDK